MKKGKSNDFACFWIFVFVFCVLLTGQTEPLNIKENLRRNRSKTTSVTLSWEPSQTQSKHISTYQLWYGLEQWPTNKINVPATNTTATVSNLKPGTVYVFWLITIDVLGQESQKSNVIRYKTLQNSKADDE